MNDSKIGSPSKNSNIIILERNSSTRKNMLEPTGFIEAHFMPSDADSIPSLEPRLLRMPPHSQIMKTVTQTRRHEDYLLRM